MTSTSTSRLSDAEKLTADNYGSWKQRVYGLMLRTKLWSTVNISRMPTFDTNDAGKAAQAVWEEKDGQALGEIIGSLSTAQLSNINGIAHAFEAWARLAELHRPKSSQNFVYVRTKLDRTRLEETTPGTMQAHITELRDVMDQLTNLGEPLKPEAAAVHLLSSITHKDYSTVIAILSNGPMADLTFDKVAVTLLAEERRLAQAESTPGTSSKAEAAYVAANGSLAGRDRKVNNNKPRHPPCDECGFTNHPTAKCYRVIGYPEGHRLHSSAPPASNSKNATAALAFAWLGAVLDNDSAAAGPKMPTGHPTAAIAQASSTSRVPQLSSSSVKASDWLLDSGASMHLCHTRQWFADFSPISGKSVVLADGRVIPVMGRGRIDIDIVVAGRSTHNILKDVLFVPDIAANLLSVAKMTEAGLQLSFHGQQCVIRSKQGTVIARAVKQDNRLYRISARARSAGEATSDSALAASEPALDSLPETSLQLAHQRMGHLHFKGLHQLRSQQLATDIPWTADVADHQAQAAVCDSCQMGKSHRAAMPQAASQRATQALELVHSDICGPMRTASLKQGAVYFITFIDDFSRFTVMYAIRRKSEAFQCFLAYKAYAENTTGKRLRCLRSDGGGEYHSAQFNDYLRVHGITRQTTPPHTPEHNGVAERANRTLVESAKCMLHTAQLPPAYWALALAMAAFIRNRSPTRALQRMTPYEAWTGAKPSLAGLRVFGCLAYVHIPKANRSKLEYKARPCIFVGYSMQSKAYLCYDRARDTIITSRDVEFAEHTPGILFDTRHGKLKAAQVVPDEGGQDADVSSVGHNALPSAPAELPQQPVVDVDDDPEPEHGQRQEGKYDSDTESHVSFEDTSPLSQLLGGGGRHIANPAPASGPDPALPHRRSARHHASSRAWDIQDQAEAKHNQANMALPSFDAFVRNWQVPSSTAVTAFTAVTQLGHAEEPTSFAEAMGSADHDKWEQAAKDEMDSIQQAGTWTLTPLPAGRQAIGCKWVFKVKRKADGTVDRYKMRLVAKGFSQKPGVDYEETFAPVAKFATIRALLSMAAHYDLEIHQMDVRTAFLNGDLEQDIYMKQPEGFVAPGKETLVCKLRKSLYGLRQASRAWYDKIHHALVDMGCTVLSADTCVYQLRKGDLLVLVALYVDDLLLLSNSLDGLSALKKDLCKRFSMADLGEAHYILGIQIDRDRATRTLSISQREYVHKVLQRFEMADCKAVTTPLATNAQLTKADSPLLPTTQDAAFIRQYQSAVGALMYAMMGTRPDLAFAVAALSQFSSNPGQPHWDAIKHVLRYLRGTTGYKLTYGGRPGASLLFDGYCDSDWGSNIDDRRSITGYVFMLGGGAVSWQSKKQPTVALSSVEAEYMAAAQAAREALWWQKLLHELGVARHPTTVIHTDSQGSIALSKNPEHHARSKHIDIRHHFIREQVVANHISLQYVPTEDMLADVMTKPLGRDQHSKLIHRLGVHSV
jgi:transposase InsO family protein